jgi:hypothetical protein
LDEDSPESSTCENTTGNLGEAPEKATVVLFLIDGAHAHDLATLPDLTE